MACNSIQLANIARDCEANVGGIKKVWLTNYADDMFQLDTSGSSITGVTSGKTWYTYEFRKGTGSLTSNLNVDEAFSAYKSLLKLRPNDLNAITGMADCYFLGSTLDNFKGEEVINLFEEYDITLDKENSYLILNYMLEIMKYCRIYFREAERTKKDNK